MDCLVGQGQVSLGIDLLEEALPGIDLLHESYARARLVRLARLSAEFASENSKASIRIAEEAVALAEDLVASHPDCVDLLAITHAYLGNARRAAGDLLEAQKEFDLATKLLFETGSASIFKPEFLSLKASLLIAQERYREAISVLDHVQDLYLHSTRDPHLAGRVLVKIAFALGEMGEPEAAINVLKRAEALIDSNREPRLIFIIKSNLMDYLARGRHFDEARALLPRVRKLASDHGRKLDLLRVRWVEAKIMVGLGEEAEGYLLLDEIRLQFKTMNLLIDFGYATLELAEYKLKENPNEAASLASQVIEVFRAQGIENKEAQAARIIEDATIIEKAGLRHGKEIFCPF